MAARPRERRVRDWIERSAMLEFRKQAHLYVPPRMAFADDTPGACAR